ncbi:MAG: DEAD/DEAH box helicase [Planctomycetes bacterium]|nr:DEAD/DEAH box helicase [Planctomycetota bacterium]
MLDPLPIDAVLPELLAKLREHASVVLRAPTGAGKTTRVPPALLDAKVAPGRILVLEPRRLAARAAARRMAQERRQRVGDDVGYHVRFDRQVGPGTRVIVMTPGILLRMLHDDPFLEQVGIVVFDEFHERALDNDLALDMIRLLQTTVRPDLRIVVMSATLATEAISHYLGDSTRGAGGSPAREAASAGEPPAPRAECLIISSEGRLHPVEIVYEPRSLQQPWPLAAARAVEQMLTRTDGDILCFLPGMQEIRQTMRELSGGDELVLPLHGDLTAAEQDRALLPQDRRRIVLATNVAETSVTVEGVTAVVDTGLARIQTFDASVGMDRLELTPIAKDAADQRAGRAGRTRPGVCVRLWSEASHVQRPAQTLPEIRRVDLAGAVLHLLALGETDVQKFPWLEPPRQDTIDHAMDLLRRLGALHAGAITELGRSMARLPVHPRLSRMLLEGRRLGQAPRVALAAALLSERDPFMRGQNPIPRRRRAGSYSDVLDRVAALEEHEAQGSETFEIGTLNTQSARFLLRARDQLLRTLQQETDSTKNQTASADDAVLRALLVAFPDRVARRRDVDPAKGIMVGGVGVRLAPWCSVSDSELFLAIDVDADPKETLVRQASSIEREWLPVETRTEIVFDDKSERLTAHRNVYYEDLLLEQRDASLPASEEVSRQLADAARTRLARVLPAYDSTAGSFLLRLRWLREAMPELGLPAFTDDELRELLPWACAGCRTFDEVRRADWLGLLQSKMMPAQVHAVEREAPERLQVPSGSSLKLQYELGRPPVLAVRIQEMFGLADTPRVAGGRVRVLLHLLAPNQRPQQVTDDLASFWNNTYQQVRKELRIRYPKHAWPEDPWNAQPQRRPKRKTN